MTNREYEIVENRPYDTFAIVELWPGGVVRSPFVSKEEAIKREEEIGEYYGWEFTQRSPGPGSARS